MASFFRALELGKLSSGPYPIFVVTSWLDYSRCNLFSISLNLLIEGGPFLFGSKPPGGYPLRGGGLLKFFDIGHYYLIL